MALPVWFSLTLPPILPGKAPPARELARMAVPEACDTPPAKSSLLPFPPMTTPPPVAMILPSTAELPFCTMTADASALVVVSLPARLIAPAPPPSTRMSPPPALTVLVLELLTPLP